MCILIDKPAGKKLDEEIYRECWRINNDGVGFAYVCPEKNDLVVDKGFMNLKDAIEAIKAKEDLAMIIHFRRVSKGANNKENTHPFFFESRDGRYAYALAHNGTLPLKPNYPKSDTHTFVDQILLDWLDRDPSMLDHENRRFLFEQWMGERNKMIILQWDRFESKLKKYYLNPKGAMTNEKDGVWFSNYSWVPFRASQNQGAVQDGYGGTNVYDLGDEKYPDHIGWRWNGVQKCFIRDWTDGTGSKITSSVDHLSYRKPHEMRYKYGDKEYDRYELSKHTVVPVQTTIPKLTAAEGDEGITVPRDLDKDDWERDLDASQGLSTCKMDHLSKREKKQLRRLALDYVESSLGRQAKTFTPTEAITYLRHEYRETFPALKHASLIELDKEIMTSGGLDAKAIPSEDLAGRMGIGGD